jgi:hypothetical protein
MPPYTYLVEIETRHSGDADELAVVSNTVAWFVYAMPRMYEHGVRIIETELSETENGHGVLEIEFTTRVPPSYKPEKVCDDLEPLSNIITAEFCGQANS